MSCVQLAGHCHTCSDQLPTCFRYIEEHVQRTGVAIETQGFTFITSGRKRESLTVSVGDLSLYFRISVNVFDMAYFSVSVAVIFTSIPVRIHFVSVSV